MKLGRKVEEYEKRERRGRFDQITLCACMKSSNNKKIIKNTEATQNKTLQQTYVIQTIIEIDTVYRLS